MNKTLTPTPLTDKGGKIWQDRFEREWDRVFIDDEYGLFAGKELIKSFITDLLKETSKESCPCLCHHEGGCPACYKNEHHYELHWNDPPIVQEAVKGK